MDPEVAIRVENLSKTFRLPHEKHSSVKSLFVNFYRRKRSYEVQHALRDVSFEIKKGEFFGIVGRNGSGKSTLLKLMAGIYSPTRGEVKINGSLTPFIELGVGFNPELTGRENVYLNGALLGFNRKEMNKMYKEIVEFAELEKFMDQKLKNYSSGMQVRLAFSIAMRAHSDTLLLDEVLAVGDENFKRKCLEYFDTFKRTGRTIVFVSHDMSAVRQFCDRAILVANGNIVDSGSADYIATKYSKLNLEAGETMLQESNTKLKKESKNNSQDAVDILNIWTMDKSGNRKNTFSPNDVIKVGAEVQANSDIDEFEFGITFSTQGGIDIFATNSVVQKVKMPKLKKGESAVINIEVDNIFSDGFYGISASVTNKNRSTIHSRVVNLHKFEVGGWELTTGLAKPESKMTIETK